MEINIVYTSLTGNVKSFSERLANKLDMYEVNLIDFTQDDMFFELDCNPTVAIVPTYMDGDNGISGETEIMTEHLREFLEFKENYKNLIGVIGSGNKNFNWQYCLTAKQYAKHFDVPLINDFELRGTEDDIDKSIELIDDILKKAYTIDIEKARGTVLGLDMDVDNIGS